MKSWVTRINIKRTVLNSREELSFLLLSVSPSSCISSRTESLLETSREQWRSCVVQNDSTDPVFRDSLRSYGCGVFPVHFGFLDPRVTRRAKEKIMCGLCKTDGIGTSVFLLTDSREKRVGFLSCISSGTGIRHTEGIHSSFSNSVQTIQVVDVNLFTYNNGEFH